MSLSFEPGIRRVVAPVPMMPYLKLIVSVPPSLILTEIELGLVKFAQPWNSSILFFFIR